MAWDATYDAEEFTSSVTAVRNTTNKNTIFGLINFLYGERYSIQQFKGDIPEWTEETGNHEYAAA